ncbi:hypothetical protein N4G69_52630 [Streptomyces mirabilis]|uniref:hypothetical protein n=1 Tax=Streptomyces mirabilis TaxID=68239 RepID=UPI0021C210F1|nr:hypothetical protein [Streptomyces mirabilis]MCT9114007.1 hypothetical protein [Streptomyces mirabilis]
MTVTLTNAKTSTDPKPGSSDKPTHKPTGTPSAPADKLSSGTGGAKPASPGTGTPDTDSSSTAVATPIGESAPKALAASLAHTGADATPWIAAGVGLLVAGVVVTLIVARRRTADGSEPDDSGTAS